MNSAVSRRWESFPLHTANLSLSLTVLVDIGGRPSAQTLPGHERVLVPVRVLVSSVVPVILEMGEDVVAVPETGSAGSDMDEDGGIPDAIMESSTARIVIEAAIIELVAREEVEEDIDVVRDVSIVIAAVVCCERRSYHLIDEIADFEVLVLG